MAAGDPQAEKKPAGCGARRPWRRGRAGELDPRAHGVKEEDHGGGAWVAGSWRAELTQGRRWSWRGGGLAGIGDDAGEERPAAVIQEATEAQLPAMATGWNGGPLSLAGSGHGERRCRGGVEE